MAVTYRFSFHHPSGVGDGSCDAIICEDLAENVASWLNLDTPMWGDSLPLNKKLRVFRGGRHYWMGGSGDC